MHVALDFMGRNSAYSVTLTHNFTIKPKPNSPFWYHYDLSSV